MNDRIEAALSELVQAIREDTIASFTAILSRGGEVPTPFRSRGKPGPNPKGGKRAKGAKRDPREIESLTKSLLAAIRKNPGQRIEQISKAINVSTKDLALPVAKLWEAKAIKTTGQKRATKYFAK